MKEEEQLKEKVKKDYAKELEKKSALSKEEDISIKMATQSRELINVPYDLDAEVIDAQVSGKHVILTWMPSEGADGYNIYENGLEKYTSTTERVEFDISTNGEYNYTVKAYKGSQESESSDTLTVICGDITIYDDKWLQNNCVYGDCLTVAGGTLDLNGKMLKVYNGLLQKNDSLIYTQSRLGYKKKGTLGKNC